MHELSLCQNIIEIVEQQCLKHNVSKITDLWLEVGVLSCVEPSALEFCFETVAKGTPAENCQLHILPIVAEAWCWQCQKLVQIEANHQCCPECGGADLQRRTGDELRIKEMAVSA